MKFQILNNEKLQFFNDVGELTGEIFLSGSGDMLITPTSASGDIILGSEDVVGSVEIGNVNVPATLSLLGGGTITSNGNTLTIGDSGSGDQVIIGVPITASNVISSSYALTASHALNAGGGGGGSTFPFTGDAQITGSLLISGSNPRIEFDNAIIIGSGSGESLTTGVDNIILGSNAGNNITTGNRNIVIGKEAGRDTAFDTESDYIMIGYRAGADSFPNYSYGGVYIGREAGSGANAVGQVFIGGNAGQASLSAYSVGIGDGVLRGNGSGGQNTAVGGYAMSSFAVAMNNNVAVGYKALGRGANYSWAYYNTAIGSNAGDNLLRSQLNTLIGYDAASNLHGSGNGGTHSATELSGSENVVIGAKAGDDLGDGRSNIIIGYYAASGSGDISNQVFIGSGSTPLISGSLSTQDIIFYNTASAPSFSGSFQGDGSQLTGTGTTVVANPGSSGGGALSTITIGGTSFSVGGGGGGSSIFSASAGFQKTINNLIVSQSNTTSSLTVINSGSTVFDVQGSVGQLFEVQDGLDGVLMSVNDISGIPILTVSSSGDVILAEGSTLQGTAATASFVPGASVAFPFAGAGVITGSLDITGSGDDIFKVRSSSGSLFSVDDGLDGILMSVNDISGLPLFEISSSGDVELVVGDISGSATSTASFGHLMNNGVNFDTAVSSSAAAAGFGSGGGGGGSVPAGTVSGSAQITQLGFVTSSATASFITAAQTASFMTSSLTGSFNNLTITNFSGSEIPGNGSTSSIAVTVVSTGAGNKYALDGTITASISLTAGNSYKFDQSDSSNSSGGGHPFRFSTDTGGSSNYSIGVTINGSPGSAGAYTQISVTNSTPTLYYYCTNHANMGLGGTLSIITGSLIQNGFLEVSGSTRLSGSLDVSGSFKVQGASGNVLNIGNDGSFTLGQGASGTNNNPDTSVVIGKNATVTSDDSVVIGDGATTNTGGQKTVVIGHGASVIANTSFGVVVGENAYVNGTNGVALGRSTIAGGNGIAIGRDAEAPSNSIAIGKGITANASQLEIGFENPTISASLSTGHVILSGSTGGLQLIGSGSTLFEVIGSEGTIFSLDDELDGTLFTVNDRSGIPQLLVSSSGRIEAEEGEAVIRSQRPIVTVGTNPFTASADNAGQYFRVGGNVTCSIFVSASVSCPIGAEFDFFQTSSAGNMLFETGSGVTLNSKNGNLNLAGQFSSATLKYVNNDEWDLMGDLT